MTKFQPGNTLGGRTKGSRNAITKAVLDIVENEIKDSLKDGNGLSELRKERPDVFWRFVGGLIPRELDLGAVRDTVSFTMVLHEPKPLKDNDSAADAAIEILPVRPTQAKLVKINGGESKI